MFKQKVWAALAVGVVMVVQVKGELFPFVISYDAPDNVVNMSHLLHAPAGKHGNIRVEGGRFVNDRGVVRFNSTNLTGPANFPTHEEADQLAERLARFGINCVRLHYHDAEYGNFKTPVEYGIYGKGKGLANAFQGEPGKEVEFDPEMVDRQDYLIAALKKRGIYVNMNLHVARFSKARSFMDREMVAAEKKYARKLLTRVNPYTGLKYTDDPCVAMVEINNENAFYIHYFLRTPDLRHVYDKKGDEMQGQWNEWLKKRYGNSEAMRSAWGSKSVPLHDEQIPEGKFENPLTVDGEKWFFARGASKSEFNSGGGVAKIEVITEGNEMFPKLYRTVKVEKDKPYTLSFKIRRTKGAGKAALGLAVGETHPRWCQLGLHNTIEVAGEWLSVNQTFFAHGSSETAQIQITRFPVGEYEIADLSFQSGATVAYGVEGRIEDGSLPLYEPSRFASIVVQQDFSRFIWQCEQKYWLDIYNYLKNELKLRAPVSGTQLGYTAPQLLAELDYIDSHYYWCHPSVKNNWNIRNAAMVNSLDGVVNLANQRIMGKPFTVSEYNHPFPNHFGAEALPMLSAYAAMQGWDGIFQYTYNHSPDFTPQVMTYFFSMICRTDVLAHLPACAAIYLRGDVREADSVTSAIMSNKSYFQRMSSQHQITASVAQCGVNQYYSLFHKVGIRFSDTGSGGAIEKPALPEWGKQIVSESGELLWNRERAGKCYWCVDTPNTKVFSGYPEGREFVLGDIKLYFGKTHLGWSTLSMTSRNGSGFGGDGREANILLAATGVTENKGVSLESMGGDGATFKDRIDWGRGPMVTEGVVAVVTLPSSAGRTRCFALDERGERKGEVPVIALGSGCSIGIGPAYKTVWYEIAVAP